LQIAADALRFWTGVLAESLRAARPFTQEPAVVDEQVLEIQGEVRERLNHRAQPCSVVPQPVNRTVHLNVLVDELIRLVDTVPVAAVDVAT
jgi:hypothetical protein